MRALKYKVKVVKSVLEWSHGIEWSIEEIFIPEKGIYPIWRAAIYTYLKVSARDQVKEKKRLRSMMT